MTTRIEEIVAAHVSDGKRLCYAESLGPVTIRHSGYKEPRVKMLLCTQPLGHEGDHKDNICCYITHPFTFAMATKPNPERANTESCVECGKDFPCDVALLGPAALVGEKVMAQAMEPVEEPSGLAAFMKRHPIESYYTDEANDLLRAHIDEFIVNESDTLVHTACGYVFQPGIAPGHMVMVGHLRSQHGEGS